MQTFIHYLQTKNHSASTQRAYVRCVNLFIHWFTNDVVSCTKADVLNYLSYLQTKLHQQNNTRSITLTALNHYFKYLQQHSLITNNPTALINIRGTHKKHLHTTFTADELNTLYTNYYNVYIKNHDDSKIPKNQRQQAYLSKQRNYIMLGILIYQGITTNELQNITLQHININNASITIQATTKSNQRTLPLNALQIGALLNYIHVVRVQFFTYCNQTDNLFFALPVSGNTKTHATSLMGTIKQLTTQVRYIQKNFTNFKQLRASVITQWLQTQGLRKAQYNAGHRYISSTESYLPNNLNTLIDDITKYNPY
jgi:site-specific recombinase XerD